MVNFTTTTPQIDYFNKSTAISNILVDDLIDVLRAYYATETVDALGHGTGSVSQLRQEIDAHIDYLFGFEIDLNISGSRRRLLASKEEGSFRGFFMTHDDLLSVINEALVIDTDDDDSHGKIYWETIETSIQSSGIDENFDLEFIKVYGYDDSFTASYEEPNMFTLPVYLAYIIYGVVGAVVLLAVIGFVQMYAWDATIFVSCILLYGLYTWDFYSDVIFSVQLYQTIHIADIFFWLFIASLVFLIVPVVASIVKFNNNNKNKSNGNKKGDYYVFRVFFFYKRYLI